MTERPVVFHTPEVRAIIAGQKTEARWLLKPLTTAPIPQDLAGFQAMVAPGGYGGLVRSEPGGGALTIPLPRCPRGGPGDRLWVREVWAHDAASLEEARAAHEDIFASTRGLYYRATEELLGESSNLVWSSPLLMPRWASRLDLEVVEVRVERLQSITPAGARAEGHVQQDGCPACVTAREFFARRWDELSNGSHTWSTNPPVWVVKFEVVS